MHKMRIHRRVVLGLFSAMLSLDISAQNIQVHGVVKDTNGETIIGASVVQKGTKNATVTDLNGAFTLSVPANSTLSFTYMGYKEKDVPLNGKNNVDIVLAEDNQQLSEVVVVGYGTMRKRDLTGAVGSLANKDLKDQPVANLGQALQGKVSGLQVIDAGKPGDNVSIKIRGLGSINNCDPLVVIDGVPTDLGLNNLNMADVERIDVLKDASATAIYGSRGANGVILITTMKGKDGRGHLILNMNLSAQKRHKKASSAQRFRICSSQQ